MAKLSRLLVIGTLAAAAASCGNVVRSSRSPVFLNVNSLVDSKGANTLLSDVENTTAPCSAASPCIFDDSASATLAVTMKDVTLSPTTNNDVIVNRYHVKYTRTDGNNVQGVDVPYEFDGAVTAQIPANGTTSVSFEIVRHASKVETPLIQLRGVPSIITAIAEVTFYGTDQVGNEVSASGSMLVEFGDFADK